MPAFPLRGFHGSTKAVLGDRAGVADRDRRPVGEHDHRLLVELVELAAALLLGQI
jgi:hypothetical protein